jgi:hypothetical protein
VTPTGPVRHLVLDTEAASALLSSTQVNPKRAAVITAVAAASGERVVPTAVRGEAGWDRTEPGAANANRLITADDVLDRAGANRVAQLRRLVSRASVVDAAVALAAERVGSGGGVVEVLTSDVADLQNLSGHIGGRVDVVRL